LALALLLLSVLKGESAMLKISILDSPTQRTLVLAGTLIEPWVAELNTTWNWARVCPADQHLVVDLKDVTRISQEGENALLDLMNDGARFFSDGVQTKHILRQLTRRCKKLAERPVCVTGLKDTEIGGRK
jgi:hypothetical protein